MNGREELGHGRRQRASEPASRSHEKDVERMNEATKDRRKSLPPKLTPAMKLELMSIKKVKDPWSEENQLLIDAFHEEVCSLSTGDKSKDLVELAHLLEGSTKIFSAQADEHYQRVMSYREQIIQWRSQSQQSKARATAAIKEADGQVDSSDSLEEDKKQKCLVENGEKTELEATNKSGKDEERDGNDSEELKAESGEVGLETGDGADKNPATDSGIESEPSTDESHDLMNDLESNTLKRTQDLMANEANVDENNEPVVKKKKIVYDPPALISCHEELEELVKAGLMCSEARIDMDPPLLDLAVRLSRKKYVLYTEDKVKDERKPHEITLKVDKKVDSSTNKDQNTSDSACEPVCPQTSALNAIKEGLAVSAANAAAFSAEDQTAIQECINELHYLPFTFELSKADLASAFNKTVERMSLIFQKNNVEVTRNMVKEASVITTCNSLVKEPDKPSGSNGVSIHPAVISLGDIYNTFVKSCREECESFMSNSKAILERTKEKSFAESRANIRAMIAELQRNIVPKFARVPLMAENTPEFFQHVTMFEKRMKKVLEEDAKKEEFDVRKYEREVLEVTVKESNEIEGSLCEDTFLVPQSPMKSLSIDKDISEIMAASPSTRSSFDGSQSSSGGGWVPLRNIFQHMKNIDKTEAARLFYAVLALLSYQNLDMNYDQLYSAESAALITKQLQTLHTKDDDLDNNKFHRGVKICTSRCPDIDKEEVFVSALTSESRDEAFRHLLAEQAKNPDSTSNAVAGSSSSGRIIDEGIAEAMADFIEESGSMFHGRLESKKRKRKADTS